VQERVMQALGLGLVLVLVQAQVQAQVQVLGPELVLVLEQAMNLAGLDLA
jgi:hypothetical protein